MCIKVCGWMLDGAPRTKNRVLSAQEVLSVRGNSQLESGSPWGGGWSFCLFS